MTLPPGKIPIDLLKEVVFKNLGTPRKEVVIGPTAGVDSAVINAGDKDLIVSMDPITGAIERIGWLAVNVNANDIATFGVEPAFLFSCLMLPEKADRSIVETISRQMNDAAAELSMAIVGGHAESTPGLTHPIVVGCAVGITPKGKYVTAANAKAGDSLILTKSAGIEGTAILASDRQKALGKIMTPVELRKAREFYRQISVVKDALTACKVGGVHAMHDPTEGGLAGGIHEMADASHLGVTIFEDKIPVLPETSKICDFFQIDKLQLISSGALLVSAKKESAVKIVKEFGKKQINASIIGELTENSKDRVLVTGEGKAESLPKPTSDHLWIALAK